MSINPNEMKKSDRDTERNTTDAKTTKVDSKKAGGMLDDKDEKVRNHRATDIQKPVVNKSSNEEIDKKK